MVLIIFCFVPKQLSRINDIFAFRQPTNKKLGTICHVPNDNLLKT